MLLAPHLALAHPTPPNAPTTIITATAEKRPAGEQRATGVKPHLIDIIITSGPQPAHQTATATASYLFQS